MLDALVALELSQEKVSRQFGTDREMSGTRRRRLLFGRKRGADARQAVPWKRTGASARPERGALGSVVRLSENEDHRPLNQ